MKNLRKETLFLMGTLIVFPLIDLLNGFFLIVNIPIAVGVVYRLFFFCLLTLLIGIGTISESRFTVCVFFFVLGNTMILLLQAIVLQNPLSWVIEDVSVLIKYFLWLLIPYYISQHEKDFQKINFEKLFLLISLLFTIGLLVPFLFGVGTATYTYAGYKGYYYAQNDLSIAFIISITFTAKALLNILSRKWTFQVLWLFLLFTGNLICLLLIGTKAGIVYGGGLVIYFLFLLLFKKEYASPFHQLLVRIISGLITLWIVLRGFGYVVKVTSGVYERFLYFYYQYNGDLLRLLSSSRILFLEGGAAAFLNNRHSLLTFFFGQGFEYRNQNFGRMGLIEMDFFDVLFGMGVIGFCLFLMAIGYFAICAFQKNSRSIYSMIYIVILIYSFFAGHVFFSAMSSMFLGLVCGGIILSLKKDEQIATTKGNE